MKIAIIGAGPSGLVSSKYSLDEGHEIVVYEQSGDIGGTWMYTDKVGIDEDGFPVHSSMYQGLMTNVPKEIMTFLDFPYPHEQTKSYIPQREVIGYFNRYADTFNLKKYIKFYKRVINVKPLTPNKWIVTVQDAKTKVEETNQYDAVFICSGHYNTPNIPKIPGQNIFKGRQSHSHDYRCPKPFKDEKVLVIGGSYSGTDIAELISPVTKKVVLCYRTPPNIKTSKHIQLKFGVSKITENGAIFADGTETNFDAILYCTGYKYYFPFLNKDCEITIQNNWVRPLYKHIVNVQYPTMCFIGIPFYLCEIPALDIEARFALATIGQKFTLPSKEDMLKELEENNLKRIKNGWPEWCTHKISGVESQEKYFHELSTVAAIRPMPLVLNKILDWADNNNRDFSNCIKIIDNENFVQYQC